MFFGGADDYRVADTLLALLRRAEEAEASVKACIKQVGEEARLRGAAEAERDRLREALRPFAEAARLAAISGRPPFQLCEASDYERARTALSGGGSKP